MYTALFLMFYKSLNWQFTSACIAEVCNRACTRGESAAYLCISAGEIVRTRRPAIRPSAPIWVALAHPPRLLLMKYITGDEASRSACCVLRPPQSKGDKHLARTPSANSHAARSSLSIGRNWHTRRADNETRGNNRRRQRHKEIRVSALHLLVDHPRGATYFCWRRAGGSENVLRSFANSLTQVCV